MIATALPPPLEVQQWMKGGWPSRSNASTYRPKTADTGVLEAGNKGVGCGKKKQGAGRGKKKQGAERGKKKNEGVGRGKGLD